MLLGRKSRKRREFDRAATTWHLEQGSAPSLYGWVALQMGKGAVVAAALFFGVIAFVMIIRAISFLLPEDPYAALETGRGIVTALV